MGIGNQYANIGHPKHFQIIGTIPQCYYLPIDFGVGAAVASGQPNERFSLVSAGHDVAETPPPELLLAGCWPTVPQTPNNAIRRLPTSKVLFLVVA